MDDSHLTIFFCGSSTLLLLLILGRLDRIIKLLQRRAHIPS